MGDTGSTVNMGGASAATGMGAGAVPVKVDDDLIKDIPGAKAVWIKDLLAVVADREWNAVRAAQKLKVTWSDSKERRISRWEHEAVLETVQDRLDRNPDKMRVRRQTVEHPFGTIKAWMGATHFQMRRLPKVASEMALHVLAYNMKRVMQILGVCGLMAAMRA